MMKFPYIYWRGRYRPLIEIELINKTNNAKRIRTLAYADTGATYSVFHSDFCEELGINPQSGKRNDIVVGDGGTIVIYLHDLKIKIGKLEIIGKIGFSDRIGLGIDILGMEGMMNEYLICFDGKNKEVVWHV